VTSQPPQSEKFKEAARALGCDESEAAFDTALCKVATAPIVKPEPAPSTGARNKPAKEG
jgi:hypothetical protein